MAMPESRRHKRARKGLKLCPGVAGNGVLCNNGPAAGSDACYSHRGKKQPPKGAML